MEVSPVQTCSKLISVTPLLGTSHVGVSGLVYLLGVACRYNYIAISARSRILNDLEYSLSNVFYIRLASVLKHVFGQRPYRISCYSSIVSERSYKAEIKSCQSFSEVYLYFIRGCAYCIVSTSKFTSSNYWPVRDCSILIPPKSLLLLQISYWEVIQLFCFALLQIRGKTPVHTLIKLTGKYAFG